MKMVLAIIRRSAAEQTIKALDAAGVRRVTMHEVKGVGEQVEPFREYTVHSRLVSIVPDAEAERVIDIIVQNAHSGFTGDGIVALLPVEKLIRIKTREEVREEGGEP